jgi:hypothetical protein
MPVYEQYLLNRIRLTQQDYVLSVIQFNFPTRITFWLVAIIRLDTRVITPVSNLMMVTRVITLVSNLMMATSRNVILVGKLN